MCDYSALFLIYGWLHEKSEAILKYCLAFFILCYLLCNELLSVLDI